MISSRLKYKTWNFFLKCLKCVKSNIVGTRSHIFVMLICRGFFAVVIWRSCLPWRFAVWICRSYLPWELTVAIYRNYFPWEFAETICRSLFVCESKPFFCVRKSFLIKSKQFLYGNKTWFIYDNFFINSGSFCYCRGSYEPL